MNKMLLFWMFCLAATAGVAGFARSVRAEKPAEAVAAPVVPAAPSAVPATRDRSGPLSRIHLGDLVATLVYSLLGLAIALFGYKVYDWITPFDLRKELEIDQNTSLGIVCGSIILGLCIIVAAAILAP